MTNDTRRALLGAATAAATMLTAGAAFGQAAAWPSPTGAAT